MFSTIALTAAWLIAGYAAEPTTTTADLTLATPAKASSYLIDEAYWECKGTTCHSSTTTDMPALRACKRVVAETGAVTAFAWRGETLNDAELALCNTRAK